MSIQELTSIVHPPLEPIETGDRKIWKDVENELGLILPGDYRELAATYGSGNFLFGDSDAIEVFNPYSPGFLQRVRANVAFLRDMKKVDQEAVPFDIYPENPGLFQWGHDDNGWNYCWLTERGTDKWPIVIGSTRPIYFEQLEISSITGFLAALCSKRFYGAPWRKNDFSGVTFSRNGT